MKVFGGVENNRGRRQIQRVERGGARAGKSGLAPLQDSMRKLGKLGWQRKWHGGIPEEGTKEEEKSFGLKSDHEGKRL